MIDIQQQTEIEQALVIARSTPHFVFVPRGAGAHVVDALRGHAAATGKQLMDAPAPSRSEIAGDEFQSRDVPVVKAGDHRGFIKRLSEIARGDAKVK